MNHDFPVAGARPRALFGTVRADATDPQALMGELQRAVAEMRAENDRQLKAKADDAVVEDKIGRINAAIGDMEGRIDAALARIAADSRGDGQAAPRDPEYSKAFASYFRTGSITDSMETMRVRAAVTKTDNEGGFLAPVEWDRTIAGKLKQTSIIRQYASQITISGPGFRKVFSDRVVGSGWVGESAARPMTTTPALGSLDFVFGEIYANPAATQGMIDDAEVDIERWLADEVNAEFDRQEGIAFLSGDGVNKPHGILTYVTGAANAARHPWGAITTVNSGNAALLTGDGILNLIYALPEEYQANAVLFMNRTTAGAARRLKDGQNNYLWQPAFEAGQPATIAGVPVVHLPAMPAVAANAVVALYGDMAETYQVIDNAFGTRVMRDPFTNKPFVHFYTTRRVGGGVKNPEAMRALTIAA